MYSFQTDSGLTLLLPLYHFLRNTSTEVVHDILIRRFGETRYIRCHLRDDCGGTSGASWGEPHPPPTSTSKENVTLDTTLLEVLYRIQKLTKNGTEEQKRRKKEKGNKPQRQHQQQQDQQHESQLQHARRTTQLHNIKENEAILSHVTVRNLLSAESETYEKLKHLDLTFVLGLITHEHLHYPLTSEALQALIQLKDVRNNLFHPRLKFTQTNFEEKLKILVNSTRVLYEFLQYPQEKLENLEKLNNKLGMHFDQEKLNYENAAIIFGKFALL